ncbi:MAG: cadmium resistance transporter, partial [Cyanobacteria bacterium Co-bin13]|nr:cadmium resistance transporter [Cyanobacteria bacterium Co-bin13]
MTDLLPSLIKGVSAFIATNLDDVVILLLFFSQASAVLRRRHIVAGQYLGFAALVLASLPGFLGGALFPQPWVGMLGLVPIAIGLNRFFDTVDEAEAAAMSLPETDAPQSGFTLLSPQSVSVAAITFANGGDNIGIYM